MASERTELDSAELLNKLRLAIANQPEEVPDGWKTSLQWSQIWNISPNAAGIILSKSARIGEMESRKFRIITGNRGAYPTIHYRQTQ